MDPGVRNQSWKRTALYEEILSKDTHTPFFILTETHFKKSHHLDAEVNIPGYITHRADRSNRTCGGVAIYLHNSVPADKVKSFSNSFCEVAMVYSALSHFIIAGVYRPPQAPFSKFQECLSTIQEFVESIPGSIPELFVAGDFNLPFIDWRSRSPYPNSTKTSDDRLSCTALLEFMSTNFLDQLVEEPTREKNILDLVLTNNPELIHSVAVQDTNKSDHREIVCNLLHPQFLPNRPITDRPSRAGLDDVNFNAADWAAINEELDSIDWTTVTDPELPQDRAWSMFEELVTWACSQHAPSHERGKKRSKVPRCRQPLLRAKKRINARINCLKRKSNNLQRSEKKLKKLLQSKAVIELQLKENIKQQRKDDELSALSKIKANPKAFYSYAKKFRAAVSSVGPLKDEAGELVDDPVAMGNLLQKQYHHAFSDPSKADIGATEVLKTVPEEETIENISFDEGDVMKAIKAIDASSAPGPDKFPVSILKECATVLAPILCQLWRNSLDTGDIAQVFKTQSVVPIFKKGSRSLAANYRPVSLTSHLVKLFERIMRSKLVEFIETRDIIHPDQHGFQKGKSCLTQLLHHVEDVMSDMCRDENADVIYLDFSKAFDKVDHAILLKKLHLYGIRGHILQWLTNFLTGRHQRVIIDGKMSGAIPVVSGVPQGTVLGPLMFVLYINDIFTVVKHSKLKVFADDSKAHKNIKTSFDHQLLQEDLVAVVEWADRNNMELNESKFQLLQHGRNLDLKTDYQLPSGKPLSLELVVKDLGVHIDEELTFRPHVREKIVEASRKAAWILRTFSTRDPSHMLLLYQTHVRSILEYCCALWDPHLKCDISSVEAVQRSFTAKISGCEDLNYWERLKKLKLYSLQRRRERYAIIIVWKIWSGLLPNSIGMNFPTSATRGVSCIRPIGHSKFKAVNSMRQNSFVSRAAALFNTVPVQIKALPTLEQFKAALDKYLGAIPDTPPIANYIGANNNSLMEWAVSGIGLKHIAVETL